MAAVALAFSAISVAMYAIGARGGDAVALKAVDNAERLRDLEQTLHLAWVTDRLQSSGMPDVLVDAAAYVYALGYWPFLALGLWFTRRLDRTAFRRLATALALSGLVGVAVMTAFPVAPPRLSGAGDVLQGSALGAVAHPDAILNPYAAMPSFHVAWSCLAAVAMSSTLAAPRRRVFLWAQPVATSLAVVMTANHWTVDVVVAVLLASATWALALPLVQWTERACGAPRPIR